MYATLLKVPVALILVPFNWNAEIAFMISVVSVALVPLSTSESRVFGEPAESFMVSVPFAFAAPNVTTGFVFERIIGAADENVLVFVNAFA